MYLTLATPLAAAMALALASTPAAAARTLPGVNHKPVAAAGMVTSAAAAAPLPGSNGTTTATTMQATIFGHTCRQPTLLGGGGKGRSTLQATCRDEEETTTTTTMGGAWWLTSLNLNLCLGNDDGKLVFRERGDFDATCRPCGIETLLQDGQLMLRCACVPRPGAAATFTEMPLYHPHGDAGVRVVNGRLVCGSHQGTKSPRFSADDW